MAALGINEAKFEVCFIAVMHGDVVQVVNDSTAKIADEQLPGSVVTP